jgi:hypothetical protein
MAFTNEVLLMKCYYCSISLSPNGWTNDFLCLKWFEKSFIPQATTWNKSGAPILLVYDGHRSHTTTRFIHLAQENNIILLCLPPDMTHKLQPLDVGVFGPFQHAWIEHCDKIVEDTGEEMPKSDFIKEYMAVWQECFEERTILQAWKKSSDMADTVSIKEIFTLIQYNCQGTPAVVPTRASIRTSALNKGSSGDPGVQSIIGRARARTGGI